MPSCSKAKNPRGIEIVFTENDHKYRSVINNKEISYISGTTFLGKFFPQFDPTGEITARCAKREGISVAEMKARWSAKGKESCRLGTRMHENCEDIELGRPTRNKPENEIEALRFKHGEALAHKLYQTVDILGVEKIVFSDRLPVPIAGTIDLFAKSRKTGEYLILDWKTNEKIEQDNKYKNFCLEPITHIDDNSLSHYALQLSLYQYLLKFEGYVPKDAKFKRALLHITPEKSEIIQCPDYTNEIKDMIIWNSCNFNKPEFSTQCNTVDDIISSL